MAVQVDERVQAILEAAKAVLREHVPPLHASEAPDGLHLSTVKANLKGDTSEGQYFASTVIKTYGVGFYFYPIYSHPEAFSDLDPDVRKLLKGKSCFHLTKTKLDMVEKLRPMVKTGLDVYDRLGLV